MDKKPLKRHKALQPLSREHHHGLLLSWKIRSGLSKNIPVERIKAYTNWFFKTHLVPHFEMEEKHIFPILNEENQLIKRALSEHRNLEHLFNTSRYDEKTLNDIEGTLEAHIRFEERILFPEIQNKATDAQLLLIESIHSPSTFEDKLDDEFWK
ncbi:hemerythrin domain-containing protein [Snuella sedimenti]|uniref:Hemerythrin domain-containing protein n=1 Tax=Snuella sedimenti TaxID=2798802 RepID=A0A8J7LRA9_9FLAO|nr:hemerythrin domain-containing protein [Snuella sedimenti]MBJ6366975.1 hemerythrin domain-containing protein [Snuella sedimenti]